MSRTSFIIITMFFTNIVGTYCKTHYFRPYLRIICSPEMYFLILYWFSICTYFRYCYNIMSNISLPYHKWYPLPCDLVYITTYNISDGCFIKFIGINRPYILKRIGFYYWPLNLRIAFVFSTIDHIIDCVRFYRLPETTTFSMALWFLFRYLKKITF